MKTALLASIITGTLLIGSSQALWSAGSAKPAPQRCLVGLTDGDGIFVAGAYDPKAGWKEDEPAKPWFTSGSRFSVYTRRAKVGDLTINEVRAADGVGGYYAKTTGKVAGAKPNRDVNSFASGSMIALSGAARPMPRVPREQALTTSLYRRAVARLLRKEGLKLSQARLTQHWRVDLNGDGIEEVLMTAHSRDVMGKEPWVLKGDYAIAALRYVVAGKVKTVPLEVDAYTRENRQGALAAARFGLMGCYDVDGDGRMEIALSTGYYEGFGMILYKFDGKSVRPVLSAGWGA